MKRVDFSLPSGLRLSGLLSPSPAGGPTLSRRARQAGGRDSEITASDCELSESAVGVASHWPNLNVQVSAAVGVTESLSLISESRPGSPGGPATGPEFRLSQWWPHVDRYRAVDSDPSGIFLPGSGMSSRSESRVTSVSLSEEVQRPGPPAAAQARTWIELMQRARTVTWPGAWASESADGVACSSH